MINQLTPESSNVRGYQYNPSTAELTVDFRSGGRYKYVGVPIQVVNELQKAESVGKFLNQNIRSVYLHDRLPDTSPENETQQLKDELLVARDTIRQQAARIKQLEADLANAQNALEETQQVSETPPEDDTPNT